MSRPPPGLIAALEARCGNADRERRAAAQRLHDHYRAGDDSRYGDAAGALAYAAGRMPATAAAVATALVSCPAAWRQCRSLLDLGCGTGAAAWAVATALPALESITAIDRDHHALTLAADLAADASSPALRAADWKQGELTPPPAEADLVTMAYAGNELEDPGPAIAAAWAATRRCLVLVEPGTPAGAAVIRQARDRIIDSGGFVAAPCPHHGPCPLDGGSAGWCHQSVRVERRRFQREIKGGVRGFEDEKFSYLIISRAPLPRPAARIVARPKTHKGGAELLLCRREGLESASIRRRDARYRLAKKAAWGDGWPE